MRLSTFRFAVLAVFLVTLASPASAAWWWPFGTSASKAPPAEQTRLAAPLMSQAVTREAGGNLSGAASLYKKVYKRYPLAEQAPQAIFAYAKINYGREKWRRSFDAFQLLLSRHPEFPNFNEVTTYQFNIALALAEGRNVRFLYIFPYKAYNRSVGYFKTVAINAPYTELAPLALMNVATISTHQHDTVEAVGALDRLISTYPNSALTEDAYLQLGSTFQRLVIGPEYDQQSTREAINYYQDYLILFPTDERVGEGEQGLTEMREVYARSKLLIGQYYLRHRRNYVGAQVFLNEAITAAPDSEPAAEAREALVFVNDVLARLATDPTYEPPALSFVDYLMFWRRRELEQELDTLKPDPALAPTPSGETSPVGAEE